MKTIELRVPDEVAAKIERAATERGMSLEELVQVSIDEKVARERAFDEAASAVLAKNAELYKRLA